MATPRTNAQIAAYWAEGLRDTEPRSLVTRTSIDVTNDVIYSYGRHFPMAKIIRDSKGTAREVIWNTDTYRSQGFTTTADHQWDVRSALMGVLELPGSTFPHHIGTVEARLKNSRRKILLTCVPLTGHQTSGTVYAVESPEDPRPTEAHKLHRTIPAPWDCVDPGPPPVDEHPERCIAGAREEYSYQERVYHSDAFGGPPPRGGFPDPTNTNYYLVWRNGVIEYGKARYTHAHQPNVTYKQCPHCAVFQPRYERWRRFFYGDPWGRGQGKGYQAFSEYIRTYGSVKAWREAGRQNFRDVKAGREAWYAWVERNTLPFEDVPVRNGRPVLNEKGEASRNALLQSKRKRRRIEREIAARRAREAKAAAERHARETLERIERQMRRERATEAWKSGLTFEVDDMVAAWCAHHGVTPNDDGTITLVKGVEDDFTSAHGALYEPDSTVIDDTYEPDGRCGRGLHFSPTPAGTRQWGAGPILRYVEVRVPIPDLCVVDQGTASKVKARHCYVVRELDGEEVTKLDAGGHWT